MRRNSGNTLQLFFEIKVNSSRVFIELRLLVNNTLKNILFKVIYTLFPQ